MRRNVPTQNLLAVTCSTSEKVDYREFYTNILAKIHAKLESYDGTTQYKYKIYYILNCFGIPVRIDTNNENSEHPIWSTGSYSCDSRALDQYIMEIYLNYNSIGYNVDGKPVYDDGTLIGDSSSEINNFADNRIFSNTKDVSTRTFKYLRDTNSSYSNKYLVCRIDGFSPEIAKGLVDKALYAEKYLKQQIKGHPFHIASLVDTDHGRSHGHETYACELSRYLQGFLGGSPWAKENSAEPWFINSPFETICDYGDLGYEVGQSAHLPAVVAAIDEPPTGNTIKFKSESKSKNAPFFFPIGETVSSSSGGSATVLTSSWNGTTRTITLDNIIDFNDNDIVTWSWNGEFPISPMFTYTFYAYGAYHDVFTFPVGAFGRHMDSGSGGGIRSATGNWCSKALKRNITSTSGAVSEPSAWGEAYMSKAMVALTHGCDAIDAWYNSITYAKNWMALVITDPLYAPFRNYNSHIDDTKNPIINVVRTKQKDADERFIEVDIGGDFDVCQIKIDYGETDSYGNIFDYYDFSGPISGSWNSSRYYFFTKNFSKSIGGLVDGQTYHFKITARDPYGNETESPDLTFVQGGADTTNLLSILIANFSVSQNPANMNQEVQFTNKSLNDDGAIFEWDFDNDETIDSTDENPNHTFSSIGTFIVSLTIKKTGSDDSTKTLNVEVIDPNIPFSDFNFSPESAQIGELIQFTNLSVNADSYEWDFDNDGTIDSTLENPSHTYLTPNIYAVKLNAKKGVAEVAKIKNISINLWFIIDNLDPQFDTPNGEWNTSSSAGFYRDDSLYSTEIGAIASWTPDLPMAGTYEVWAWWTYYSSRNQNALYVVNSNDGATTNRINQRDETTAGKWHSLGSFDFKTGDFGSVVLIHDDQNTGSSSADAIKFSYIPEPSLFFIYYLLMFYRGRKLILSTK